MLCLLDKIMKHETWYLKTSEVTKLVHITLTTFLLVFMLQCASISHTCTHERTCTSVLRDDCSAVVCLTRLLWPTAQLKVIIII